MDFTSLKALFFNCTLTKSPGLSHTERLINLSKRIMEKHGVTTALIRPIDHDIATGVWPDMREHGQATDEWPELYKQVMAADILVLAGPIWLGDNSSQMKKIIERLRFVRIPYTPKSANRSNGRPQTLFTIIPTL